MRGSVLESSFVWFIFFFFSSRRRHTRLQGDWSSDVCSSDLILRALPSSWRERVAVAAAADYFFSRRWLALLVSLLLNAFPFSRTTAVRPTLEIGRASCRERV